MLNLNTMTYSELIERRDFCRSYANSMLNMAKLYQAQGDRAESVKQCALHGYNCIMEAKRIDRLLSLDKTQILNVA